MAFESLSEKLSNAFKKLKTNILLKDMFINDCLLAIDLFFFFVIIHIFLSIRICLII